MVARVTQQMITSVTQGDLRNAYQGFYDAQRTAATGKKVQTPGDDPAAKQQLMRIDQQLKNLDNYGSSIQQARQELRSGEAAQREMTDLLVRGRELAIKAATETNTPADRESIRQEAEQILKQLGTVANQKQGGEYIFAGTARNRPAVNMVQADNGVYTFEYQGNTQAREYRIEDGQRVAFDLTAKAQDSGIRTALESLSSLVQGFNENQHTHIQAQTSAADANAAMASKASGLPQEEFADSNEDGNPDVGNLAMQVGNPKGEQTDLRLGDNMYGGYRAMQGADDATQPLAADGGLNKEALINGAGQQIELAVYDTSGGSPAYQNKYTFNVDTQAGGDSLADVRDAINGLGAPLEAKLDDQGRLTVDATNPDREFAVTEDEGNVFAALGRGEQESFRAQTAADDPGGTPIASDTGLQTGRLADGPNAGGDQGDLELKVFDASGAVAETVTVPNFDKTTQSVNDLATSIDGAATNLSAQVTDGRLEINADSGYSFNTTTDELNLMGALGGTGIDPANDSQQEVKELTNSALYDTQVPDPDNPTSTVRASEQVQARTDDSGRLNIRSEDGYTFGITEDETGLQKVLGIDSDVPQLTAAVDDMDRAINDLANASGTLGGKLNRLDLVEQQQEEMRLDLKTVSAEIGDADPAKAYSELMQRQQTLQGAMKTSVMLQRTTILDHI